MFFFFERLRAGTRDEMDKWVNELRSYQSDGALKLSPLGSASFSDKRKSHQLMGATEKPNDNLDFSNRPQSVLPGSMGNMDREPLRGASTSQLPKTTITPLQQPQERKIETDSTTGNLSGITPLHRISQPLNQNQTRQSVRDMRTAALQNDIPNSSEIPVQKSTSNNNLSQSDSTPSWGAQEDSKELQTARKRLAKAKNLNTKYETEIRNLRDKVITLTRENTELKEKLDHRENTVDVDKKRRMEELEDVKQKLEIEKKNRADLKLQFNDVKNELKILKESIHISRTTPNIHAIMNNANNSNSDGDMEVVDLTPAGSRGRPKSQAVTQPLNPNIGRSSSMSNIHTSVKVTHPSTASSASIKKPWVPDEQVSRCLSCKREFGLFTRKVCLYIFFLIRYIFI